MNSVETNHREIAVVIEDDATIRELIIGSLRKVEKDIDIIEVATRTEIGDAIARALNSGRRFTVITDNDLEDDQENGDLAPTATQVVESVLVELGEKNHDMEEILYGVISVTSSTNHEIRSLLSTVLAFEGVKWLHLEKPAFNKLPMLFGALKEGFEVTDSNVVHADFTPKESQKAVAAA